MAAKELTSVRSKFVDKASKELLNQLLDDMLEDGVLNDGEKDSILEENMSRVDKARRLIDTVKKKGDAACAKMLAHLQSRDPVLYSELGLSGGQPAAEPKMEQEWSTTMKPSTDGFWTKKQNDTSIYPVSKKSKKSRVALLITNIKFTNQKLNRDGAEKDEENMEKLLIGLGYEVLKCRNLTARAIDAAVIEFSKHPKLRETDSVFVVIMSHGKLGAVLGVDWKETSGGEKPDEFPIDNIYKHLGSEGCPALLNKPKIIIIQACRGEAKGAVCVSDGANAAELCDDAEQPRASLPADEDDALRLVQKEKDFISLLSSTPGTVSRRNPVYGSILIQYVVEVFYTYAHMDDIEELFRKVMQRFDDYYKHQMPTKERCTLIKRFYFFPGH